MGEWSLILFTICMQAAIGAYLWVTIVKWKQQDQDFSKLNIVIAALAALAMIVALLHLGTPTSAFRALSNIGSSWLSRENFFGGAFFGLAVVTLLLEMKNVNHSTTKVVRLLTGVVGILAVFSMSMLYMNSVMPAWNHYQTLIDFCATTVVLGGILTIVMARKQVEEHVVKIAIAMALAVFIHAAVYVVFLAALGAGATAAQASIATLSGTFGIMLMIRWLLVLGGVGAVIFSQYAKAGHVAYMYAALAMLVVGHLIGRYIFFAIAVAKGIGAT